MNWPGWMFECLAKDRPRFLISSLSRAANAFSTSRAGILCMWLQKFPEGFGLIDDGETDNV